MRILIVEDEKLAAERLKKLLHAIDPGIQIMTVCDSVESSVTWLKNNPWPELIFMDIEIADGRSFDIFKNVTVTSPVIFITSYNEFAIKAIKLNALDYLLKPIDKEELKEAVFKAQRMLSSGEKPDYQSAYNSIATGDKPKKLAVSDLNGARFVDIDKIVRLKADSNYTHIVLTTGESITSSKTLKDYEEILALSGFFRVHNTHLINLSYVDKYIKGIGGTVIMTDGASIEVSRQKKKELMEALSLNQ
ncbi:MAG TPA: LytTR family DNA-binding domain-containing protein [Bacteroidia bacterium]|jgi:two-component system LytT family response regulator|nr:LytTR family DNA-binding domain-containing protein [Bacteroidia bacterium]